MYVCNDDTVSPLYDAFTLKVYACSENTAGGSSGYVELRTKSNGGLVLGATK